MTVGDEATLVDVLATSDKVVSGCTLDESTESLDETYVRVLKDIKKQN